MGTAAMRTRATGTAAAMATAAWAALGACVLGLDGCAPKAAKPPAAASASPGAALPTSSPTGSPKIAPMHGPAAPSSNATRTPLVLEPAAPLARIGTSRLFEWLSVAAAGATAPLGTASTTTAMSSPPCTDARCGLPQGVDARPDSPMRLSGAGAPPPTSSAGGAPGGATPPLLERQILVNARECVRIALVTSPRAKSAPTPAEALVLLDADGAVVAEGLSSWVPSDGNAARWALAPADGVVCSQGAQPLRIRIAAPDGDCVLHVARMHRDAVARVAGPLPAR